MPPLDCRLSIIEALLHTDTNEDHGTEDTESYLLLSIEVQKNKMEEG